MNPIRRRLTAAACALAAIAAPLTVASATSANAVAIVNTSTIPAPTLLSPKGGEKIKFRSNVLFDWTDVPGAKSYVFMVDASSSFTGTPAVILGGVPSQQQTYGLSFADPDTTTTYATRYWRVCTVDSTGVCGPWSEVRSFQVVK